MNLNDLFPVQAELDNRIVEEHGLQGQDLIKKKTIALICELYECISEARFFKFWSKDQKARTTKIVKCSTCEGSGLVSIGEGIRGVKTCPDCDNPRGGVKTVYPLLEEYVDIIHFALSISNDLGYYEHEYIEPDYHDLNDLTIGITNLATLIPEARYQRHISTLLNFIIKLGYQLGFDEKTVIDAYFEKNKINFERQLNNY